MVLFTNEQVYEPFLTIMITYNSTLLIQHPKDFGQDYQMWPVNTTEGKLPDCDMCIKEQKYRKGRSLE